MKLKRDETGDGTGTIDKRSSDCGQTPKDVPAVFRRMMVYDVLPRLCAARYDGKLSELLERRGRNRGRNMKII
jgi:hypothetical protein